MSESYYEVNAYCRIASFISFRTSALVVDLIAIPSNARSQYVGMNLMKK